MSIYRFTPAVVLAAAGSYAAPATAAVITEDFNLGYGGEFAKNSVVIGGNATAQYSTLDFSGSRDFSANGNAAVGGFVDSATIPTSDDGITNGGVKVDQSTANQYLQLAFDINGHHTLGVATFGPDTTLESISYNSVVPEPAVWLQLIAGFALSGAGVRVSRRQRHPSAMAR